MLVQPLKELLSGQASRNLTLDNVWEKVKLYCTVYDPNSGGYRVNYSLFFEIFAGLTTLGAMIWFVLRALRSQGRAFNGLSGFRRALGYAGHAARTRSSRPAS